MEPLSNYDPFLNKTGKIVSLIISGIMVMAMAFAAISLHKKPPQLPPANTDLTQKELFISFHGTKHPGENGLDWHQVEKIINQHGVKARFCMTYINSSNPPEFGADRYDCRLEITDGKSISEKIKEFNSLPSVIKTEPFNVSKHKDLTN